MKKKLKDFFNSLEAKPEIIAHGCKKEVCQLRSYVSGIDSNSIYASPKIYNRITRITVHLQGIVSDKSIVQELRKIQSKYQKKHSRQNHEEYWDSVYPEIDYSLCMCKEDY